MVLEAMAAGAPVVGTRTGGIAETVHDGVNGLLVPVRHPPALASAMTRVLEDDALAVSLSEAGRATVVDQGVERLVDVTLETYEAALAAEPPVEASV